MERVASEQIAKHIRAFAPQGYGALPANLSHWSPNKLDDAGLLPWHSAPSAARLAFFALQIDASVAGSASANFQDRIELAALVFKALPGRLELDLHHPLPDHASIRTRTLTKERPHLARRASDRGGGRARGAPKGLQPGPDRPGRGEACDAIDRRNSSQPCWQCGRTVQTTCGPYPKDARIEGIKVHPRRQRDL